jgi:hypothetical protein
MEEDPSAKAARRSRKQKERELDLYEANQHRASMSFSPSEQGSESGWRQSQAVAAKKGDEDLSFSDADSRGGRSLLSAVSNPSGKVTVTDKFGVIRGVLFKPANEDFGDSQLSLFKNSDAISLTEHGPGASQSLSSGSRPLLTSVARSRQDSLA